VGLRPLSSAVSPTSPKEDGLAVISLLTIAALALIVAAALLVSWSRQRRRSTLGQIVAQALMCVPVAVSPIVTVVKKPP
jgi:hypothetical protein